MSIRIPQSVKIQLAKASGTTNAETGTVSILVPIPSERTLVGGDAAFCNQECGDYICCYVTDEDNVLGYGAGTVISSFQDEELPSGNKGVYALGAGPVSVRSIMSDDASSVPAGLYLKIVGQKATPSSDILYVNIHWGKRLR